MTSPYAKAIFAFLSSLIAALSLVINDGITPYEALGVAGSVLAITGGVFGLKNTPAPLDKAARR